MLGFASYAYANIGVPMIFITLPGMFLGFIPIVLVESTVLLKKLKIGFKRSFKTSLVSNGISTLVGIPVTWLILVILQMVTGGGGAYGLSTPLKKFLAVTWQSPWLIPYESEMGWMIPSAFLFLLIPFFFASFFIEYQLIKRMLTSMDAKRVRESVFFANLISYLLLACFIASKFYI